MAAETVSVWTRMGRSWMPRCQRRITGRPSMDCLQHHELGEPRHLAVETGGQFKFVEMFSVGVDNQWIFTWISYGYPLNVHRMMVVFLRYHGLNIRRISIGYSVNIHCISISDIQCSGHSHVRNIRCISIGYSVNIQRISAGYPETVDSHWIFTCFGYPMNIHLRPPSQNHLQ
jgi:hypothetical protein